MQQTHLERKKETNSQKKEKERKKEGKKRRLPETKPPRKLTLLLLLLFRVGCPLQEVPTNSKFLFFFHATNSQTEKNDKSQLVIEVQGKRKILYDLSADELVGRTGNTGLLIRKKRDKCVNDQKSTLFPVS